MRLAIISDCHVLGPQERRRHEETFHALGRNGSMLKRKWRRSLYRMRRRFWNTHPEWRDAAFAKALDVVEGFEPDWVIANGDYGGDQCGVGVSDCATCESARQVVTAIRARFPDRSRFVFGDHDLGKYSTELKDGGIRIQSLEVGERDLGIPSFWHEVDEHIHLIGVNSSLFTLDLFLPEALVHEIPEWERRRAEHVRHVEEAFDGLPRHARVILFCHDPSALHAISNIPQVLRRLDRVEMTVIGHLHSPSLLKLARLLPKRTGWRPKYPVARIIAHGLENMKSWAQFKPVVCPSTFGTGHHIRGGVLLIEKDRRGRLAARRRRFSKKPE